MRRFLVVCWWCPLLNCPRPQGCPDGIDSSRLCRKKEKSQNEKAQRSPVRICRSEKEFIVAFAWGEDLPWGSTNAKGCLMLGFRRNINAFSVVSVALLSLSATAVCDDIAKDFGYIPRNLPNQQKREPATPDGSRFDRSRRKGGLMKALMVVAALLISASLGKAETLTAAQAKAHVGESSTVCGIVASEHTATSSRGEPAFINLDSPYPTQIFTILVWGDDRKSVGELPRLGSRACATGLIRDYKGAPEIVVRSSGQLSR
jgi:hypothetical protein